VATRSSQRSRSESGKPRLQERSDYRRIRRLIQASLHEIPASRWGWPRPSEFRRFARCPRFGTPTRAVERGVWFTGSESLTRWQPNHGQASRRRVTPDEAGIIDLAVEEGAEPPCLRFSRWEGGEAGAQHGALGNEDRTPIAQSKNLNSRNTQHECMMYVIKYYLKPSRTATRRVAGSKPFLTSISLSKEPSKRPARKNGHLSFCLAISTS
jgi:hypothetical protein